jgi:hypothetical protein
MNVSQMFWIPGILSFDLNIRIKKSAVNLEVLLFFILLEFAVAR